MLPDFKKDHQFSFLAGFVLKSWVISLCNYNNLISNTVPKKKIVENSSHFMFSNNIKHYLRPLTTISWPISLMTEKKY